MITTVILSICTGGGLLAFSRYKNAIPRRLRETERQETRARQAVFEQRALLERQDLEIFHRAIIQGNVWQQSQIKFAEIKALTQRNLKILKLPKLFRQVGTYLSIMYSYASALPYFFNKKNRKLFVDEMITFSTQKGALHMLDPRQPILLQCVLDILLTGKTDVQTLTSSSHIRYRLQKRESNKSIDLTIVLEQLSFPRISISFGKSPLLLQWNQKTDSWDLLSSQGRVLSTIQKPDGTTSNNIALKMLPDALGAGISVTKTSVDEFDLNLSTKIANASLAKLKIESHFSGFMLDIKSNTGWFLKTLIGRHSQLQASYDSFQAHLGEYRVDVL